MTTSLFIHLKPYKLAAYPNNSVASSIVESLEKSFMKHLQISNFLNLRPSLHNVGFVPTMGALHQGHLNLVKACIKECKTCVVSIFVNPTQFAEHEDLSTYPRDIESDIAKLCKLDHEKIILITPTVEIMYPNGIKNGTFINIPKGNLYEGSIRPHFFTGVCTVVCKLFNLVRPDIAYFGQKDIQQASIISQMTQDLLLSVKVKVVPTARESDGLAMSSRNVYLDENQRKEAIGLHNLLLTIKNNLKTFDNPKVAISKATQAFQVDFPQFGIQYADVVHAFSLSPFSEKFEIEQIYEPFELDDNIISIVAAIKITESLRLLDNIVFRKISK